MAETCRIKLRESPQDTVSWVYIDPDGTLVVEFYDYSQTAHDSCGNDVAFLLRIDACHKADIFAKLTVAESRSQSDEESDTALLKMLVERFERYSEIEQWLVSNRIAYRSELDHWA